jgi:replication-associated recombination protein RarA
MSRDSQGRFTKGFSGNPLGRRRKTKRTLYTIHHEDEFIEATEEEFPVTISGKVQKKPAMDLIHKQLVRKAVAGDPRCMLKVIELRENYTRRHEKTQEELLKTYLDASQRFQRNPEDHTDTFREALEAALSKLSRQR